MIIKDIQYGMDRKRYMELQNNMRLKLTKEEINNGWYFCCEWDSMLIHSTWPEAECCTCNNIIGKNDKTN